MQATAKKQQPTDRGFALVATITVMSLLLLVVLGIMSLAGQASSTIKIDRAQAIAKANARIALNLAIAQLQIHAGRDQAITAPNSFNGEDLPNPNWTGVWSPAPAVSGSTTPDYDKTSRFRSWLVSSPDKAQLASPTFATISGTDKTITLLGTGTLGPDAPDTAQVSVPLIPAGDTGSLAWWTSDDSTKAPVQLTSPDSPTIVEKSSNLAAPPTSGLESITALADVRKGTNAEKSIPSKINLELHDAPQKDAIRSHWHDYTPYSRGLLTNARDGGFKQDLSLIFEQDTIPSTFTSEHSDVIYQHTYGHPRSTNNEYLQSNFEQGGIFWDYIKDYYALYKDISIHGDIPTIEHRANVGTNATAYRRDVVLYQKKQSIMPVFAKLQFLMSALSVETEDANSGAKQWKLAIVTEPVVTVWNPYSVSLKVNDLRIRPYAMPLEFKVTTKGSTKNLHHLDILPYHTLWMNFPDDLVLAPGETRVFSNAAAAPVDVNWTKDTSAQINLKEGWSGTGGYYNSENALSGSGKVQIDLKLADDEAYEKGGGWNGAKLGALYWSTYADGSRADWSMESWMEIPKASQNGLLPIEGTANTGMTFENLRNNKTDVCSFNFFLKTAQDSIWPSRSWIHGNPCAFDNHMIVYENNTGGELEPIEMAQNRLAFSVKYAGSIDLVQIDSDSESGFIAAGQDAGTGVTNAIHQEIPVLPLISIPQLQHANLISTGFAPYQSKAVGNSFAHPLLKADSIREAAYKTQNGTEELDHSFWLNDKLFDNFFFSTITPQDSEYFAKATTRGIEDVYQQFTTGEAPLLNTRFTFIEPRHQSRQEAQEDLFQTSGKIKPDAHKKSAQQIAVEGPFNINSTSKDAWKMILSSLNNQKIPHLEGSVSSFTADDGEAADNPFSRFILPASKSVDDAQSHVEKRNASWLGFRELTDDQIDDLAEQIVLEVKQRGPFLSLSDFVNRRVETGDLSTMGALQAAIEKTDINEHLKQPAHMIVKADIQNVNYDNLNAAIGSRHTGAPGYLMQSDVLTPLAPIMTVRGDTFTIRAYGDAKNAAGKVIARAWCEAVVQRTINYLDPADPPETPIASLSSDTNRNMGRRFEIISFRWLSEKSI